MYLYLKKASVISAIVATVIIAGVMVGCQQEEYVSPDSEFAAFENSFSQSLSSEKNAVKLVGFKTYNIDDDEKKEFEELASMYGEEMKEINIVFADDFSFFRIYFPLHTAIVEYEGKNYTANEKGAVLIPDLKDIGKIRVIGRKRSETVHGTGSNIIEKDRILLKNEFRQELRDGIRTGYSIEGNVCIFDFQALTAMNGSCCTRKTAGGIPRLKSGTESEGQEEEDQIVSCMQNHGGPNCTIAFGISGNNRCPFNPSHCMDYNGYFPDCRGYGGGMGKYSSFPGSDCSIAMSMGECWNEI